MSLPKKTASANDCPVCGMGSLVERHQHRPVEYQGVTVDVLLCFQECSTCGSELADQEYSLWNRRAVNRFKKSVDLIPLGSVIREMRKTAGLTQAQAGEVFGGGPVAFSKYENDDLIPEEPMANLLRLAIDDPGIAEHLQTLKSAMRADSRAVRRITRTPLPEAEAEGLEWIFDGVSDDVEFPEAPHSAHRVMQPLAQIEGSKATWSTVVIH